MNATVTVVAAAILASTLDPPVALPMPQGAGIPLPATAVADTSGSAPFSAIAAPASFFAPILASVVIRTPGCCPRRAAPTLWIERQALPRWRQSRVATCAEILKEARHRLPSGTPLTPSWSSLCPPQAGDTLRCHPSRICRGIITRAEAAVLPLRRGGPPPAKSRRPPNAITRARSMVDTPVRPFHVAWKR